MSKYYTEAAREELIQKLQIADLISLDELAMIPEGGADINIAVLVTYKSGARELLDLAQLTSTGMTLYQWGSDNYSQLSTGIETGDILSVEISGDGQWRYSNLATLTHDVYAGTYTSNYPAALVAGGISFPRVEAEEIVRFP